jgi:Protein of unknown function (DUF4235)
VDTLCSVKLLYKPFGIIFGLIAGFLSKRLFRSLWSKVDDREPPQATTEETTWSKMLGATALQALTFSLTRAAVDRFGAKGFRYLTGIWPGPKRPPEPEK